MEGVEKAWLVSDARHSRAPADVRVRRNDARLTCS
jgi:hypothetical protein